MDLASIVGLALATILVLMGMFQQGSLMMFLNIPSILIVLGGTLGGIILSYSFKQLKNAIASMKIVFSGQSNEAGDIISILVSFAEKARREGLLALEEEVYELDDDFLKKGVQLIVDGTDPQLVKSIMETELNFIEERHSVNKGVFDTGAELSPAFGMIGTLVGLIGMLAGLDDPGSLGAGMSVALITTLYGSMMANMFFLPVGAKLKVKSEQEILSKEVMIEGILSIQAGENPRIVEEKLKAFLSPSSRTGLNSEEGGGLNAEG
ncbi:chemotaxis protein MotA [Orenia metallireducens]|jgi:chemotaxis protein MotA|uniref:Chemotaxis protein MotA n=1 Tax=Orenia metallireducens TaxID=1413210 RepID=A0A285FPR2_9FIRM|nr:motility protein A [Orenia metallireducens]PRX33667.1 chemotaxis protein MotA [Orenia metallireducens]SNY13073.1 chemotaxis protein MotA [Orenia metallireducens]